MEKRQKFNLMELEFQIQIPSTVIQFRIPSTVEEATYKLSVKHSNTFRLDQDSKTREMLLPLHDHDMEPRNSNQLFLILDQAGLNTQTTVEHGTKYRILWYKMSRVIRKRRCAEY